MLVISPESLDDTFIKFLFSDSKKKLEAYFDKNAWIAVIALYDDKVIRSTCLVCARLCLESCIQCTFCFQWYHYSCLDDGIPENSVADDSLVWLCPKNSCIKQN